VLANASAGRPGSIVLLHAGPSVTPRILPALIAGYRARGFTFVTIPDLLGIANTGVDLPPVGGSSTPPDPGGAAAPTPPAIPPTGDDRGSLPISPGDTVAPSMRVASAVGRGWDAAPLPGTAGGSSGTAATASLARDSAWTRGPSRDGLVAGATVALLVILLLLGVIAGRRARRTG